MAEPRVEVTDADLDWLRTRIASWRNLQPQEKEEIEREALFRLTKKISASETQISDVRGWLLIAAKRSRQDFIRHLQRRPFRVLSNRYLDMDSAE